MSWSSVTALMLLRRAALNTQQMNHHESVVHDFPRDIHIECSKQFIFPAYKNRFCKFDESCEIIRGWSPKFATRLNIIIIKRALYLIF